MNADEERDLLQRYRDTPKKNQKRFMEALSPEQRAALARWGLKKLQDLLEDHGKRFPPPE
jgi:Spy/CpxP family protein refolding chaperone